MSDLLVCRKCDVFVGYAAVGIVKVPRDKSDHELGNTCWVCGRTREEIEEAQREEDE